MAPPDTHSALLTHCPCVSQRGTSENVPLCLDVCANACARGMTAEGASGMELTTNLGAAAGSGAAAGCGATTGLGFCSAGQSGTVRTRHSTGETHRECAEGAISMSFLESYFSQVRRGGGDGVALLFHSQ